MRALLCILLVCLVVGFFAPTTYWTFVVLSRTIIVFLIGFMFGYLYKGIKGE